MHCTTFITFLYSLLLHLQLAWTQESATTTAVQPNSKDSKGLKDKGNGYGYLTISPYTCNDPAQFKGHGDVQSDWQGAYASAFCKDNKKFNFYPDTPALEHVYKSGVGITYGYRTEWMQGCWIVDGRPYQNLYYPQTDGLGTDCLGLFYYAFHDCELFIFRFVVEVWREWGLC